MSEARFSKISAVINFLGVNKYIYESLIRQFNFFLNQAKRY